MRMLYDEIHTKTDIYEYNINGGGEYHVEETGIVRIVFENKKFKMAAFPLRKTYTRNGWRIMAAINEKIEQIERDFLE